MKTLVLSVCLCGSMACAFAEPAPSPTKLELPKLLAQKRVELDAAYVRRLEKAEADEKEPLKKAQEKWLAFFDADREYAAATSGGSGAAIFTGQRAIYQMQLRKFQLLTPFEQGWPTLPEEPQAASAPSAARKDEHDDSTQEFYDVIQLPANPGAKEDSDEDPVHVSVRMISGPWTPQEHKIEKKVGKTWKTVSFSENGTDAHEKFRIDGREEIWGADGFGWPKQELKLFVVKWGDKIINVTRKHTRDYYSPLLYTVKETQEDGSIGGCWSRLSFDPATQELIVVMNGGGGAGWYRATWRIKEDGTIKDTAEFKGE